MCTFNCAERAAETLRGWQAAQSGNYKQAASSAVTVAKSFATDARKLVAMAQGSLRDSATARRNARR